MEYINESLHVPILKNYDVFVAGGGIAGISAALAAARCGANVLICENSYILGGLATSGLICYYLPIDDGMGRQVSFGIAEELLRLSAKDFPESYSKAWIDGDGDKTKERFITEFNPHLFSINLEKLLLDAGADILYGTKVCAVQTDNGRISCVITENKSGRQAFKVKSVVDATGDADICVFAGEDTEIFEEGNTVASWYVYLKDGVTNIQQLGFAEIPSGNNTVAPNQISKERFSGINAEENSKMMFIAHDKMRDDIMQKASDSKTFKPVTMPTIPQLRMTRRLSGITTMNIEDEHKNISDSIGMISSWRDRGPIFEVPFKALTGKKIKNLICAGRCISASDKMWDISRVIPPCAVTGQAAGTAAAMSDDFSNLSIDELQEKLQAAGVILHENDLKGF